MRIKGVGDGVRFEKGLFWVRFWGSDFVDDGKYGVGRFHEIMSMLTSQRRE
jgi:hypothetical protein